MTQTIILEDYGNRPAWEIVLDAEGCKIIDGSGVEIFRAKDWPTTATHLAMRLQENARMAERSNKSLKMNLF